MFDIAWSELALIGGVALLVIGPKDLPKVMRTMGQWTRKAKLLAGEFQRNMDDMIRETELADIRNQVQSVQTQATQASMDLNKHLSDFNPANPVDLAAAASLKAEAAAESSVLPATPAAPSELPVPSADPAVPVPPVAVPFSRSEEVKS